MRCTSHAMKTPISMNEPCCMMGSQYAPEANVMRELAL